MGNKRKLIEKTMKSLKRRACVSPSLLDRLISEKRQVQIERLGLDEQCLSQGQSCRDTGSDCPKQSSARVQSGNSLAPTSPQYDQSDDLGI